MKRFGVNWLGILAANAAISVAVLTGMMFLLYELFAVRAEFLGRPPPIIPGPVAIFNYMQALTMCCMATWLEYDKYKDAVNGKVCDNATWAASWTPDIHPVSRYERFRHWLIGTSFVGVPNALAHFFTGKPSVVFVLFITLLAPAFVVFAQMAKRHFYRTGVLNRRTLASVELPVATTASVAPSVTQPDVEKAILSIGNGKKP